MREGNLERWRHALEKRGMEISRNKIEYISGNEWEAAVTMEERGHEAD